MTGIVLPLGLVENPRLEQWIGFERPGEIHIFSGKVELGQGILTALVQIAADELDVSVQRIALISGQTHATPREGFTAGSLSVEHSGGSIRLVAAEVRGLLLRAAARRLNCAETDLTVVDGTIHRLGLPTDLNYWQLASGLDLSQNATGSRSPKPAHLRRYIGTSLPRVDLPAKVLGGAQPFIHDLRPANLLHARVIRQPWPGADLAGPETVTAPADIQIVRLRNFVAVVAATEQAAVAAAEKVASQLKWTGGIPLRAEQTEPGWIATQPSLNATVTRGVKAEHAAHVKRFKRTYTKPFIAHASIGPSCALARFEAGKLHIWTHSQGVFPLRDSLAKAMQLDVAAISVEHVQGAGCYGHNGADDAACDAAILAREIPGKTIRVMWSREDELAAAPFGTAMVVALEATLSPSGMPIDWTTEVWGGPHAQRPGAAGGVNLLGAEALPNPPKRPPPIEIPEAAGGSGLRNAPLLYDVPHQTLINHIATGLEPRTSSMRGLGAFANVFAIESFIDELAAEAGVDSVAYRLAMTSDPRARAVMEQAARMADWTLEKASGQGRGFAYSRYKNRAGYLAVFVDVEVDDEVRLKRVWCAVDAGLVISPDGVRNQVEGGLIQAASWALKESVAFDEGRVASRTWDSYPILRFSEVPEIHIDLMDRPRDPSLGVGEVAQGPMAAAIGNAVADALGMRIRDLPMTRERIIAAIAG
jgi:nicotinate dehydrogenase subunit B